MKTKLVHRDAALEVKESNDSSQPRAVYIAPRLERTGSFVTVMGVSLPIGDAVDDMWKSE